MTPAKRVSHPAVLIWCLTVVVTLLPWPVDDLVAKALGREEAGQASRAVPERASKDWRRLQSPNFNVVGNAGQEEIRRIATELEAFRAVLLQMFPKLRLSSPVPTEVVVFED